MSVNLASYLREVAEEVSRSGRACDVAHAFRKLAERLEQEEEAHQRMADDLDSEMEMDKMWGDS